MPPKKMVTITVEALRYNFDLYLILSGTITVGKANLKLRPGKGRI
jgi:hypothetical protein